MCHHLRSWEVQSYSSRPCYYTRTDRRPERPASLLGKLQRVNTRRGRFTTIARFSQRVFLGPHSYACSKYRGSPRSWYTKNVANNRSVAEWEYPCGVFHLICLLWAIGTCLPRVKSVKGKEPDLMCTSISSFNGAVKGTGQSSNNLWKSLPTRLMTSVAFSSHPLVAICKAATQTFQSSRSSVVSSWLCDQISRFLFELVILFKAIASGSFLWSEILEVWDEAKLFFWKYAPFCARPRVSGDPQKWCSECIFACVSVQVSKIGVKNMIWRELGRPQFPVYPLTIEFPPSIFAVHSWLPKHHAPPDFRVFFVRIAPLVHDP